jgi:predicted DNA-binding transcriptional regulator YafY
MINRRNFLRFTPFVGLLGVLGLSQSRADDVPMLREAPEDGDWNWWRDLPRTPLARSDDPMTDSLCHAAAMRRDVTILYDGGSQPGASRRISPLGVFKVEGYLGVYVNAVCHVRNADRTFRVERITALV